MKLSPLVGKPAEPAMLVDVPSFPAFASALEVLSANGVEVMIAAGEEYTPTPAILTHNGKEGA